jgi:hypothetical protein
MSSDGEETHFFVCDAIYIALKLPSCYQDRLGTNIDGKQHSKKETRFCRGAAAVQQGDYSGFLKMVRGPTDSLTRNA